MLATTPARRTAHTEEVDGGVAKLTGDCDARTGNALADVEKGDEAAHCTAAHGRQPTPQRLDAERGKPVPSKIGGVRMGLNHSHSMVPGGFDVTS